MIENAVVYARQSRGKAKSIKDQTDECSRDAEEQGWHVGNVYEDGISASRFAERTREAWPRVLRAIERGSVDVLVLWESSRGDREAETWLALLRRCRLAGVLIRITSHGRTYDVRQARDWRTLAEEGIDSAYESEKLSLRTRRGVAAAARAGRPPAGVAPYGYQRVYDPRTGALVGQEPDPAAADVVREIFDKLSRSVPISTIVRSLNARGVPAPAGGQWRPFRVRALATNPAFLGMRKHKDATHPAGWPALVEPAVYYAVQRILFEPNRLKHARPGRQTYLLSYLAECAVCGTELRAKSRRYYVCPEGHLGIRMTVLDSLITDLVLQRLAQPDVYARMRAAGEEADREVLAARNEIATLKGRLEGFRRSAAKGETSPESLAFMEAEIGREIAAAEKREAAASAPPELREFVAPGVDVRARWDAAPVTAKRAVIRRLLSVQVLPAGQNSFAPVPERVRVAWV